MTLDAQAAAVVARWRARAEGLRVYAERCRRSGDPMEANDADAAAGDYMAEADELETLGSLDAFRRWHQFTSTEEPSNA